jgi:cytochrome P450
MLAGFETTATTLSWLLYELATDPVLQARAYREIVSSPDPLALESVMGHEFLGRLINETLRLHPPGWSWTRRAIDEDVILGHRIQAGQTVLLVPYVTHRHPAYWKDPTRFDPDREPASHKWAYYPFGAGPRVCIGQHFAMLELKLIVTRLIQSFEFTTVSPEPPVPAPQITLKTRDGLRLWVRPRG